MTPIPFEMQLVTNTHNLPVAPERLELAVGENIRLFESTS